MLIKSTPARPLPEGVSPSGRRPRLNVAYVMQNVGVDIAADVGQAILIKHTIHGLEKAGHRVTLLSLQGRAVAGMENISQPEETWQATLGLTGTRPFQVAESATRRLQRMARLPYLAFFDSLRFYEACCRTLPAYSLCHEYAGLLSTGAAYACKRMGIPYFLTVDADLLLESAVAGQPLRGYHGAVARWAASKSYQLADRIVCVSRSTKQNLIEKWRVEPQKIEVIPNGVNVQLFEQAVDSQVTRTHFGIGKETAVIMFVGGFQPWHGLELLLESFAQVLNLSGNTRLVLVGDGPTRPAIEKKIDELGIRANVVLTGMTPHDQVPNLLAMADIVTVPYPRLPQQMWFSPLKLFEYMAAGKAIVASGEGQINEVIKDGRNGILTEPGDVDSLVQAIIKLIRDPSERERLGQNAQRQAANEHSWDKQISRLEELYYKVLRAKRDV